LNLKPIAEEISSRSARNGFLFASIACIILSTILLLVLYDVYFRRTQKLLNGYIPEINSSLSVGDVFFAKKMLSSIQKSNYFSSIYIYSLVNNNILVLNGDIPPPSLNIIDSSKLYFKIYKGNFLFITVLPIDDNLAINDNPIVVIQKVNYFLIFLIFLMIVLFWTLIFIFVKNQSKKNYEKMFVPIMKLSENLKEISLSKENYNKFITYHELDIIYKNFNKVYIDLKEAQNQLKQMEMMRAVSSTIQKLAHDLRHPFAHIKNSLHVMLRLSSYEEIRQYILETGKSIEKDILGVENMLSDLLHFRTEESPHFVDTSFYQLLYSVIKNSFEMQKKVEISLDYKFNHKFMICVDIQKMERVLSNIITNAIEAMQGIGEMSFATREFVNDSIFYFELCISNTNSYIDENSGDKIFDLFFTQGKQRGTGLGLGIAKEIIEQHRGKIFYTSSVTEGVKFYIQLPQPTKLKEDINDSIDFPGDANFFVRNFDSIYNNSQVEYEKRSNLIEEKILSLLNNKSISKKFQILILEDDETYIKNFSTLISSNFLSNYFEILPFKDFWSAYSGVKNFSPEFIICDIDLGIKDLNGFDFVKKLREEGSNSKICIHTNRFLKCDLEKSLEVNSDFFIAKPMSRFQFLKFIYSYFNPECNEKFLSSEVVLEPSSNSEYIIVIDDEYDYHKFWSVSVYDAQIKCFFHPDAALKYFIDNPDFLNKVAFIIVDYYYDKCTMNVSQMSFIESIRKFNYKKPIIISTNASLNKNDYKKFDGVISKQVYSLSKLNSMFPNNYLNLS